MPRRAGVFIITHSNRLEMAERQRLANFVYDGSAGVVGRSQVVHEWGSVSEG